MALLPDEWRKVSLLLLVIGGGLVYRVMAPMFPKDRVVLVRYDDAALAQELRSVLLVWTGENFQPGEPAAGSTIYVSGKDDSTLLRSHVRLPDGPFWVTIESELKSGETTSCRRKIVLDGDTVTVHVPRKPRHVSAGQ